MLNLLITEFEKMRRYSILWIGVAGVAFIAALAAFQTSSIEASPAFMSYVSNVVWNNLSLAFPCLITLLGGFLIDREYTDHTLKNMLTVPISFRKLLAGKLLMTAVLTILLALISFACALVFGTLFLHCEAITPNSVVRALSQIAGIAFFNYIAVCPIVAWFGRRQGSFFTGVGIAFFYGFCGIFAAGRGVADFYPVTAGLGIVGFTDPGGETHASFSGIVVLALMAVLTAGIIAAAPSYDKATEPPSTRKKIAR